GIAWLWLPVWGCQAGLRAAGLRPALQGSRSSVWPDLHSLDRFPFQFFRWRPPFRDRVVPVTYGLFSKYSIACMTTSGPGTTFSADLSLACCAYSSLSSGCSMMSAGLMPLTLI